MLRASPVTLLVVLLLHFCSPTPALNALAPHDGLTLTGDIAYADGPRHTLDVYAPRPAATPAPVLVFFYGGGWSSGAKAMYRFIGAAMAARGMLVVIPDYRLHPEVSFPAFMDDMVAAVAWAHANAAKFGGDPHRLFLMGHSAGGQIAALLALDAGYLRSAALSPERDVCGVIGLAAPYDYPAARQRRCARNLWTRGRLAALRADQPRVGTRPADAAAGGAGRSHDRSGEHDAIRRSAARDGRQWCRMSCIPTSATRRSSRRSDGRWYSSHQRARRRCASSRCTGRAASDRWASGREASQFDLDQ